MKLRLILLAFLAASPAMAADNAVVVTPGSGVTMRSVDVGAGVQSMGQILVGSTGTAIYGTAGTANANVLTVQGIASMTPFLANPGTPANWAIAATAAAVPANAIYMGINTAGNLVGWTGAVTNTGTFAVQAAESGTWNITNISGTVSLPTGASTAANQTNASAKTQIVDGSGNVIASTSNNLNVQCANCSGSGASAADAATFTAGTSTFAPAGGQFTSGGATACVTGHQCLVGITAARGFLTDMSSIAGTTTLTGNGTTGAGSQRVTIASDNTPFNIGVAQGSTTSGQSGPLSQGAVTTSAPSYTTAQTSPLSLDTSGNLRVVGTGVAQGSTTSGQTGSPVFGAVTTSSPTYTTGQSNILSLDTSGSLRVALNATPSLANGNGVVPTIAGAVYSATNGAYFNQLQGNAVLSVTNPGFYSITDGTNKAAVKAASTAPVTATDPALVVDLRPDSPGIIALGGATTANSVPMVLNSQYPVNSVTITPTAVTNTATGTTAATVATLGATASVTNFICGFTITADATALATGTATVAGTVSGSLNYLQTISAAANGTSTLTQNFNPCIPASAVNTAITVTSAAAGTGGNVIVNVQGYRL